MSVLTVFDDDVEEQYVYGKGKIENLSMLMKKSSAPIKSHESNLEIIEIRSEDNDSNLKKKTKVKKDMTKRHYKIKHFLYNFDMHF